MSWYDYLPVAGSVARLAEGDYGGAVTDQFTAGSILGSGARLLNDNLGSGPDFGFDAKKSGYDVAQRRLAQLGAEQKAFQMEGLKKAENYYLPAQEMNKAIYGTPDKLRK